MIRFFAAHPTAANIVMLVIVFLGLAALPGLNKETFPEIKNRTVQVTVPYPGATPLEVEQALCNPLEDETDGISFLEEQICIAKEGVAVFTVKMKEAGDMRAFLDDVNSAVDGITRFPDDTEEPVIEQLGRTQPVVSIALMADATPSELKKLADYFRRELLKLPEIPMVDISGFSNQEYRIQVDPEALGQYQLSVDDIAQLIRQQSVGLPSGTIKGAQKEYQIRFENERRTREELEELVILEDSKGGQVRVSDIGLVEDRFENMEQKKEINGLPAAILKISKNTTDDTLTVFNAVSEFVVTQNEMLPKTTRLTLTEDNASIVQDRLSLLLKNGWQGLLLASLALLLFFNWRYTFWVALGLPISFIGGLLIMSAMGVTINMISMVALLMAIGILMDDAIVIAESIASEFEQGGNPLEASVNGVTKVGRGVLASFMTSSMLFGSLLFLQGDMGQVMRVLPVVLLAVLSISLLEAFFILPHHLKHSLAKSQKTKPATWRKNFEALFERLRNRVGQLADLAIEMRYFVVGSAIALLIISFSLLPAGVLKFKFFPDLEGNILEARIILPQGAPLKDTEAVVNKLLVALQETLPNLAPEPNGQLVKNIQIAFGDNLDAGETGAHLATITLDLLDTESRHNSLNTLKRLWEDAAGPISNAISVQYKEPVLGPAGKAVSIRLQADSLDQLSAASWKLQHWLAGYDGVSNIMDDLRPGKKQFVVNLLPGTLGAGLNNQDVASQLRAAYQGVKVSDVYNRGDAYEVNVALRENRDSAFSDITMLPIFNQKNQSMPLAGIADIQERREYSRITRVDHHRTVTVSADVDSAIVNTNEVIEDTRKRFLPALLATYPGVKFALEGEVKNSGETNSSILIGFILGIVGVYFLLSLQFANYYEPLIVMMNIPLALIGVFWGHLLMGLDLTMPSMIGFVSLAGVVVNDSILLVEFVKIRRAGGMSLHSAAGQAVRDRFRAIFLTSVTTIAGMLPLLSESSLQAQVLVPLVASIVFGMMSSTVLILIVLPAMYTIVEDVQIFKSRLAGNIL